jgi:hypothetical protein
MTTQIGGSYLCVVSERPQKGACFATVYDRSLVAGTLR